MRIDAIKNKVSKIRDLLEDLKSEVEIDICDLEERENLNERQEEKYEDCYSEERTGQYGSNKEYRS